MDLKSRTQVQKGTVGSQIQPALMETLMRRLHPYILPNQRRALSRCCRTFPQDCPLTFLQENNLCWKKTEISGKETEESKSQTLLISAAA